MPLRYFENAAVAPLPGADGAAGTLAFHRRLPGYEPTPLVDVPSVADELGLGRLLVKNESSRLGLPAFKMLGASWATYRLLCDLLGGEPEWETLEDLALALDPIRPLTLVAATDGNHGRAVARTARLLGLDAEVFVPEGTTAARIEAIEGEGASVAVVHGTYDDAVAVSATRASDRRLVVSDTSWPGYEDVPGWVIDGYETIFAEVDDQMGDDRPDAVVIQMGVGAFAAAAARHYRSPRREGRRAWLLGVEPDSAACVMASVEAGAPSEVPGPHRSIMAGLNCGKPSLIALPVVAAAFDAFVAIDDDLARRAMRQLAAVGIVAGETGGAGLAGLEAVVSDPGPRAASGLSAESSVLVICTEGATDPAAYADIVGGAP